MALGLIKPTLWPVHTLVMTLQHGLQDQTKLSTGSVYQVFKMWFSRQVKIFHTLVVDFKDTMKGTSSRCRKDIGFWKTVRLALMGVK